MCEMLNQENKNYLLLHPHDNVLIALQDLNILSNIQYKGIIFHTRDHIPKTHGFFMKDMHVDELVILNGQPLGRTKKIIKRGALITIYNVRHDVGESFINMVLFQD